MRETEYLRQAEPGALADLLGGEERFEDAFELLLRNPDAGILDGYGDIAVRILAVRVLASRIWQLLVGAAFAALRTEMVSWPRPSMASRALTAMLIMAVSN